MCSVHDFVSVDALALKHLDESIFGSGQKLPSQKELGDKSRLESQKGLFFFCQNPEPGIWEDKPESPRIGICCCHRPLVVEAFFVPSLPNLVLYLCFKVEGVSVIIYKFKALHGILSPNAFVAKGLVFNSVLSCLIENLDMFSLFRKECALV